MSTFPFPKVDPKLVKLQQQLAKRIPFFTSENVAIQLTAALTPAALDTQLQVIYQGTLLSVECHSSALETLLANQLNGASFCNLPQELQLALLERISPDADNLSWQGISEKQDIENQLCLQIKITLPQGDICLYLKHFDELISLLPKRTLLSRLPVPIALSLRWGNQHLSIDELRSLCSGDLLLLPKNVNSNQLVACIHDKPFATFNIHDHHLELVTMETSTVTESELLTDLEALPINVSFEVGQQTLDLHTLSTLTPGAVIELGCALNAEVRVIANQKCIGTGELVSIQDRLGVRIGQLHTEVEA